MQSLPKPARYLLRVDDLCPTVHRERWGAIRALVQELGVRPILAIIPDNQDEAMEKSPADPEFWQEMRGMQEAGATIAMHGLHHACRIRARSLVPLHHRSEFAGRPFPEQCADVRAGLQLLRDQGLNPHLFVAPKHSFDRVTLQALCAEGLPYICDGFARVPFQRDGVTWIPQQLWGPSRRQAGLWTICLHPNTAGSAQIEQLRRFLRRHANQFTSFGEVIAHDPPGRLGLAEQVYAQYAMRRVMLRMKRRRDVRS
ncbi:DUF2334 domain-containing protein [Acidobacteria bacterium AB60]|nr:DUF2334 domain-containing protein [Acidobacteria bacterium AB60]